MWNTISSRWSADSSITYAFDNEYFSSSTMSSCYYVYCCNLWQYIRNIINFAATRRQTQAHACPWSCRLLLLVVIVGSNWLYLHSSYSSRELHTPAKLVSNNRTIATCILCMIWAEKAQNVKLFRQVEFYHIPQVRRSMFRIPISSNITLLVLYTLNIDIQCIATPIIMKWWFWPIISVSILFFFFF